MDMARMFDLVGRRMSEATKAAGGRFTVLVHPQLVKTVEEAKELDGDWKGKEAKQVSDNIARAMAGRL